MTDDQPAAVTPAQLADERRDIALRVDDDWGKYGIDAAERERWIEAGIPADHAPLAAIAKDVGNDSRELVSPEMLRMPFGRETVLDMLLRGDNSAQIMQNMLAANGMDSSRLEGGSWMQLISPPSNSYRPKPADLRRMKSTDTHPSRTLETQDRIATWLHNDLVRLYALASLQDEATYVLDHADDPAIRQPGGDRFAMIRVVAGSYGVLPGEADLMARIAAAIPLSPDVPPVLASAVPVTGQQDNSWTFHANPEQHRALIASAALHELPAAFDPDALPGPAGFGWLAGDDHTPARMIGWGPGMAGQFIAGIYDVDAVLSAMMQPNYVTPPGAKAFVDDNRDSPDAPVVPRNEDEAEVLAMLLALIDDMEERGAADPSTEPPETNKNARRRNSRAAKSSAVGDVALVYARGARTLSAAEHHQRQRDHRWPVRGHWREQWYPSMKTHARIWIEEHFRGPADAPMRSRQQVHVMKPRDPQGSSD